MTDQEVEELVIEAWKAGQERARNNAMLALLHKYGRDGAPYAKTAGEISIDEFPAREKVVEM